MDRAEALYAQRRNAGQDVDADYLVSLAGFNGSEVKDITAATIRKWGRGKWRGCVATPETGTLRGNMRVVCRQGAAVLPDEPEAAAAPAEAAIAVAAPPQAQAAEILDAQLDAVLQAMADRAAVPRDGIERANRRVQLFGAAPANAVGGAVTGCRNGTCTRTAEVHSMQTISAALNQDSPPMRTNLTQGLSKIAGGWCMRHAGLAGVPPVTRTQGLSTACRSCLLNNLSDNCVVTSGVYICQDCDKIFSAKGGSAGHGVAQIQELLKLTQKMYGGTVTTSSTYQGVEMDLVYSTQVMHGG
jgi:hypothetical protein